MDLPNRTTKTIDQHKVEVLQDQVVPIIDGMKDHPEHNPTQRSPYSLAEMAAASETARQQ